MPYLAAYRAMAKAQLEEALRESLVQRHFGVHDLIASQPISQDAKAALIKHQRALHAAYLPECRAHIRFVIAVLREKAAND